MSVACVHGVPALLSAASEGLTLTSFDRPQGASSVSVAGHPYRTAVVVSSDVTWLVGTAASDADSTDAGVLDVSLGPLSATTGTAAAVVGSSAVTTASGQSLWLVTPAENAHWLFTEVVPG
jgi:hypothetical protein